MELIDIRTDARYHISPQLTSSEYPDVDLDRNANRWYRTIIAWALLAGGEWKIQGDTAAIDFPLDGSVFIPNNLLTINRVEVKYPNSTGYVIAYPETLIEQQSGAETNATRPGDDQNRPTFRLFGKQLIIRPAPASIVTNGINVFLQKDVTDLDAVTYTEPQVMEPVKRAISYGAAMDFCLTKEMWNKYRELKKIIFGDSSIPNDTGIKGLIDNLYSVRADVRRDSIRSRRRSYK